MVGLESILEEVCRRTGRTLPIQGSDIRTSDTRSTGSNPDHQMADPLFNRGAERGRVLGFYPATKDLWPRPSVGVIDRDSHGRF